MSSKQERVEIYIQEDMDASQRSLLAAKLGHKRGIIGAWFEGGDHHHLTVHYERDHFSHITLLDTIKLEGFHGNIIGI